MYEDAQWNAQRNGNSQEHKDYDEHEAANEHGAYHDGQWTQTDRKQTDTKVHPHKSPPHAIHELQNSGNNREGRIRQ